MKLLLTSCGWEYNPEIAKEFLHLAGKKPAEIKIFLVTTAGKKDKDWKWVRRQVKMITALGILDKNIRVFSLDRKIKKNELEDIDTVYVCGGNTFLYLHGIRKTGLDKAITKFVKGGGLYYGISAGSIVAGPDIAFIAPLDDPSLEPISKMLQPALRAILQGRKAQGKDSGFATAFLKQRGDPAGWPQPFGIRLFSARPSLLRESSCPRARLLPCASPLPKRAKIAGGAFLR